MSFAISFSCSRSDFPSHLGKRTLRKISLWEFINAYPYLRNLWSIFINRDHSTISKIQIMIRFQIVIQVFTTLSRHGISTHESVVVEVCWSGAAECDDSWFVFSYLRGILPLSTHPFNVSFIVKTLLSNFAKHSFLFSHRASLVSFEILSIWETHPASNWLYRLWIQSCWEMLIIYIS